MQAGLIEGHKAAILAALSIADECFQAQDELARVRAEVSQRANELTQRIDRAIPQPVEGD